MKNKYSQDYSLPTTEAQWESLSAISYRRSTTTFKIKLLPKEDKQEVQQKIILKLTGDSLSKPIKSSDSINLDCVTLQAGLSSSSPLTLLQEKENTQISNSNKAA